MQINRRLNLVLTVERDDGSKVFIHSAPVSRPVFEAHYDLITATAVELYGSNWAPGIGMRVAALKMAEIAQRRDGGADSSDRTFRSQLEGLTNEIWRLTSFMALDPASGWQSFPLQQAINGNLIDEDALSEARNAVTFFTVASWFHSGAERKGLYQNIETLGGTITSLNSTEYRNSLPTLTQDGNTGATASPSSTS